MPGKTRYRNNLPAASNETALSRSDLEIGVHNKYTLGDPSNWWRWTDQLFPLGIKLALLIFYSFEWRPALDRLTLIGLYTYRLRSVEPLWRFMSAIKLPIKVDLTLKLYRKTYLKYIKLANDGLCAARPSKKVNRKFFPIHSFSSVRPPTQRSQANIYYEVLHLIFYAKRSKMHSSGTFAQGTRTQIIKEIGAPTSSIYGYCLPGTLYSWPELYNAAPDPPTQLPCCEKNTRSDDTCGRSRL